MKEIQHFNSTKERLKYLSGGFEEIFPKVVEKAEPIEVIEEPKEVEEAKEEPKAEEKPKKTPAKKKSSKKGKKDGEVQAK